MKSVVALQTSITRFIAQKSLPKDSVVKQKVITTSSIAKSVANSNSSTSTATANVSSPRTINPATSLSASLSANAKLPSSAEVAAESAKVKDEANGDEEKRPEATRVANGPVTTLNGPYSVARTSSPKPGSISKPDTKNTVVVKDSHVLNHSGAKLKLPEGMQGSQTDVRVGFVQHGETTTNGPTTLNGGKYMNNTISKSTSTVIHKVVSSGTYGSSGTPPRTTGNNNLSSAHPTMKIVSPHAASGVKTVTTVGRVSSGTMLGGAGTGKVVTITSTGGKFYLLFIYFFNYFEFQ